MSQISPSAPGLQNLYQHEIVMAPTIPKHPQNIIPIEKKVFAMSPISAWITEKHNEQKKKHKNLKSNKYNTVPAFWSQTRVE